VNPNACVPYVALTPSRLGNLARDENRKAEARNQDEEAFSHDRRLANQNPDPYSPDAAKTLNQLGILGH